MNDHIDPNQIAKVKEWAEDRLFGKATFVHLNAVAEVITALPHFPVDGIEIGKALNQLSALDVPEEARKVIDCLWKLLPAPPRPTLADLIEEGYDPAQYQWGQAEHRDERCIIIRIHGYGSQPTVSLLTATGSTIWTSADEVIPLPDLPRLVWPAESRPEPAEEETPEPETPRPKDVPAGEAWLVNTREGEQREALKAGNRWYVKDGDDVEEWVEEALAPIARLVPEVQE